MEFAADPLVVSLAVALGIGLLVGVERERRKGTGPTRRLGGLRTFALCALVGAIAMALGGGLLLAACAAGIAMLAAAGHRRNRDPDPGVTTEVALLLTLLLGALAVRTPALAAGLAVVLTGLLALRGRLHHFVRSVLTETELNDALMLAAVALVALPLLPDHAVDPYGVFVPHAVGELAVVVMLIGAGGHVARRVAGPALGLPASGVLSGFVSSAATIAAMGAMATRQPELARSAASAAVLSTVSTMVQMAVLLGLVSRACLLALAGPLMAGGVAATVYGIVCVFTAIRQPQPKAIVIGHAFSLTAAIAFAVMISVVLVSAAALNDVMGRTGVALGAAVAGFADTHSAAISVATLVAAGTLDPGPAVIAVLVALTTNAMTKIGLAFSSGPRGFATVVVAGQVIVVASCWAGALLRLS